ncbi:MAG: sulfotransferase domain-containing protein [Pirellulales bacterium]
MPSHVMILGCGRSGTSIFGELFEQLPGYTYHSEPDFGIVCQLDYSTPQAIKVPRESPGHEPTPGLSFPIGEMLRLATPRLVWFWIVRHPLDAIASLRVGIAQNWGHHPRPPDWQDWLNKPILAQCAHHWNHINSVGCAHVGDLAHVVQFESMIADPLEFARHVCRTAGLDPESAKPQLLAWATRVQDSNTAQFVEAKTSRAYSRPDHTHRVGRWRENLSSEEIEQIVPLVRHTAQRFGYGLPTGRN